MSAKMAENGIRTHDYTNQNALSKFIFICMTPRLYLPSVSIQNFWSKHLLLIYLCRENTAMTEW